MRARPRGPARLAGLVAGLVAGLAVLPASAATDADAREIAVGLLWWDRDPAYERRRIEAAYPGTPGGRPVDGARTALREAAFALGVANLSLRLEPIAVADASSASHALDALVARGAAAALLDLPADWLPPLARALASRHGERAPPLMNVAAPDDALRGADCHPLLFHLLPSRRMHADALAQLLASRRWTRVLVLQGPHEADRAIGAAFTEAARRLGLRIVSTRTFVLSSDPRERDRANVALLTGGPEHDVVVVHDADGAFARGVPYRTVLPRPVAGAAGAVPLAWHPLHERYGAPQLNRRFAREHGRPMGDRDWAAWMAVKAVAQAAIPTPPASGGAWRAALRDPELGLDGFKGVRLSFRRWDQQLRQPVFVAAGDAIVGSAPFPGFLHATDTLDSLGADGPESGCRLAP